MIGFNSTNFLLSSSGQIINESVTVLRVNILTIGLLIVIAFGSLIFISLIFHFLLPIIIRFLVSVVDDTVLSFLFTETLIFRVIWTFNIPLFIRFLTVIVHLSILFLLLLGKNLPLTSMPLNPVPLGILVCFGSEPFPETIMAKSGSSTPTSSALESMHQLVELVPA